VATVNKVEKHVRQRFALKVLHYYVGMSVPMLATTLGIPLREREALLLAAAGAVVPPWLRPAGVR
jgi:hypothetical protein